MASRFVHAVHCLIAYGLPYEHIHAGKDKFSQRAPGLRHRAVRHRRYRNLPASWNVASAYPQRFAHQVERIGRWKGDIIAEQYMVAAAHDIDDKVWDFNDRSQAERTFIRKCWEGICVWLVFNPSFLKIWAGVDVIEGRIHRVIDAVEVWEDEPSLIQAYESLRKQAQFLIRVDPRLRAAFCACCSAEPIAQ